MTEKRPFPENLSYEAIHMISFVGLPTLLTVLIFAIVLVIGELR